MFQEKEMYFFEQNSRKVNCQKVVIIPKMITGEILTDNQYDIIEENTRMSLFKKKIFPRDMISYREANKNTSNKENNYYFENKDLCEKVGTSLLLSYFKTPKCISKSLEEYITKTDKILHKILESYKDCKTLESEIVNDIAYFYSSDKIKYISTYDFCVQSIEAIHFITEHSFMKISRLNRDLEDIKHVLLYREDRDIISVLNKLMDTIIRFEDVRLPVTYCDEETTENEFKYSRFYIDKDDISDFITNVRRRKNNFLEEFKNM